MSMQNAASRFSLDLPAPLPAWQLGLLLAVYLIVGTTGHLPWRGDDLTYLGPIHAILTRDAWLVPELAGETLRDFPPLYYWVGALLAKALGGLLPVHDAARLASSLFTAAFLYWIGVAARRLYGPAAFAPAILLGVSSLGLVVHAHETQPALAQLAGMALCYAGLGLLSERPLAGGLQAGLGAGLAFLAGGVPALVLTLPVMLLAPLLCRDCRSRAVIGGIAAGCAIALLIPAAWFTAVAIQQPGEAARWWASDVATILPHAEHLDNFGRLLQLLGWFAWPLWPIAGWAIWRNRHGLTTPALALPIVACLLAVGLVTTTGPLRPASALPVLPAFCLLATLGTSTLRRGAANAFDWFSVVAFTFFAILVWLGWSALSFSWPPGLARQLARIAPNFASHDIGLTAAIGALISIALLVLPQLTRRTPWRGATNWALGMTLLWCLAVALWQPWFAHTKNYQPVAGELRKVLAGQTEGCIARHGVADTQRAALDYFAGIQTVDGKSARASECSLVLSYAIGGNTRKLNEPAELIWERRLGGGRKAEVFRLYRRD
ncbi:hypothetical protein [Zoogloea sp.]|uniref:hypothetical protein n=1 Tax=Zoogloea sp. TaxID=49181 RepID=UPI0035B29E02